MSQLDTVADEQLDTENARSAVMVGVWASGLRCLLQYVVGPFLGIFGFWLPWFGVLIQVLGCLVTLTGAIAAVRSRRRGWPLWASVAVVVSATTIWVVVATIARW